MADNRSYQPEHLYIEPEPPSYEMLNMRSPSSHNIVPNSKRLSSNAAKHTDVKSSHMPLCRIFIIIVTSFIIGGVVGGAISYLWATREVGAPSDSEMTHQFSCPTCQTCPICQTCQESSSIETVSEEWQLVFKAVSGVAGPQETDQLLIDPYRVWERNAPYNENIPGAKQLDSSFRGHYLSSKVRNWKIVREVKVGLFDENGNELINLIFDAECSDRMNWFSEDRLISSPWSDIFTEPQNYFSVIGYYGRSRRRWYINRNYGGCSADAGWLAIVGQITGVCLWENSGSRAAKPVFLYSKGWGYTNWNTAHNVGEADIFAIFVKTY